MSITLLGGKSILSNVAAVAILGLGALTTTPLVEEPPVTPSEEEVEELVEEEAPVVSLDNADEVEAEDTTTDEVTPPHTEAAQAPAKQATNIPKSTDKVTVTKEDPHGTPSYNGMSRMQYEDAVKYTCPSQREENIFETWRPAMSRLISIGKYSAYAGIGREVPDNGVYSITAGTQEVELSWDIFKQNESYYKSIDTSKITGGTSYRIEDKIVLFYTDWNTLTISWGKEDRDKAPASVAETADFLATSWTNYLRSLESSYKSRCPND